MNWAVERSENKQNIQLEIFYFVLPSAVFYCVPQSLVLLADRNYKHTCNDHCERDRVGNYSALPVASHAFSPHPPHWPHNTNSARLGSLSCARFESLISSYIAMLIGFHSKICIRCFHNQFSTVWIKDVKMRKLRDTRWKSNQLCLLPVHRY